MGGASSKATRRLPRDSPSAIHPTQNHAPPPPPSAPAPPSHIPRPPTSEQFDQTNVLQWDQSQAPTSYGPNTGRTPAFSGDKDDVVKRDALDPHFAANLSRLGPVFVSDPSTSSSMVQRAQRTLASRQSNENDIEGSTRSGQLSSSALTSLLRELDTGTGDEEFRQVCKEYGVDAEQIKSLRKWFKAPAR